MLHLPEKVKNGLARTLCRLNVPEDMIRDDPGQATCKRCLALRGDPMEDFWYAEDHYGEPL